MKGVMNGAFSGVSCFSVVERDYSNPSLSIQKETLWALKTMQFPLLNFPPDKHQTNPRYQYPKAVYEYLGPQLTNLFTLRPCFCE